MLKSKSYSASHPYFRVTIRSLAPFLLFSAFIAAVSIAIASNGHGSWAHNDMNTFHIPQINSFIERPFNLFDYSPASSATTPGLHIVLGWLVRILGYQAVDEHVLPLRLANAMIGCLPVALTYAGAWRQGGDPARAAALVAALAGSSYVIGSAAFVTTDNGALGFFALIVFLLNFYPNSRAWLAGAFAGLIAWRQMYVPVAGAIGLSFIRNQTISRIFNPRNIIHFALMVGPGLFLLGIWLLHWGGLVPPEFRTLNASGFRLAVALQALAMTGLLSALYLLLNYQLVYTFSRKELFYLILVGFLLSIIPWLLTPTDLDEQSGRWGSLIWTVAAHTPAIAKYSIAVLLLTWFGIVTLLGALIHAYKNEYFPSETLCLICYFIGYSTQVLAFQRYVEPQILIFLAFFTSRHESHKVIPYVPPIVFGSAGAVLTLYKSFHGS
jgi:hypothetical protein